MEMLCNPGVAPATSVTMVSGWRHSSPSRGQLGAFLEDIKVDWVWQDGPESPRASKDRVFRWGAGCSEQRSKAEEFKTWADSSRAWLGEVEFR